LVGIVLNRDPSLVLGKTRTRLRMTTFKWGCHPERSEGSLLP
jgi:hypothetical protein